MDVDAADLGQIAGAGVVGREELRDDGDGLGGVDGHALTEEGGVTHAVGVEVATVLVANTVVAVVAGVTAVITSASYCDESNSSPLYMLLKNQLTSLFRDSAWVGRDSLSLRVGLPDIHLRAAGTVVSGSRVGVVGVCSPAFTVSLERV